MELVKVNNKQQLKLQPVTANSVEEVETSSDIHFMAANTVPMTLEEIKEKHIVPVFSKSNERALSHSDIIETVEYIANQIYSGEQILKPAIRVSHKISGRHPSAVHKNVKDLHESDITTFYQRAAFVIEIPSITANVAGNTLSLVVGGARSHHETNFNSRKTEERVKLFVGFSNSVCTNLCISTDGFLSDVKVRTVAELAKVAYNLFGEYNVYRELDKFNNLPGTMIQEHQLAQILGRARMFLNMPYKERKELPVFPLSDSQLNLVVKDYYNDESFCRNDLGNINLWRLYNLFTGANKMSYIDTFLDRGVGCQTFINGLHEAIGVNKYHWFIN
ncbi:DUF3871 family protein [Draconibacterium orientale]|uniref:DUF3871 family protein n=1 Tax=Draconibacterium orientale TaxID=1168034 RepID=UPI002A0A14EA|nr:DUF3871 family protein [Draconibacterium orientale]